MEAKELHPLLKMDRLLDVDDVAYFLKCTPRKASDSIRQGKIPKVHNMGRTVRVDPRVLYDLYFSNSDNRSLTTRQIRRPRRDLHHKETLWPK